MTKATKRNSATKRKALGKYIVIDPEVCHCQPTFRGTRILVQDVLEQVASGMAWDAIVDEWRGSVTKKAIAEAVRLAGEALLANSEELVLESSGS